MSEIKKFGHYYKNFKLQGIRKITVVDIDEKGMATIVFGHRAPTEAAFFNKMYCFVENILEDVPEEVKAALDLKEKQSKEAAEAKKKAEEEERSRRAVKIAWFVEQMQERGIEITEATASWLTDEQMEASLKEVDQAKPEEGFMLF